MLTDGDLKLSSCLIRRIIYISIIVCMIVLFGTLHIYAKLMNENLATIQNPTKMLRNKLLEANNDWNIYLYEYS